MTMEYFLRLRQQILSGTEAHDEPSIQDMGHSSTCLDDFPGARLEPGRRAKCRKGNPAPAPGKCSVAEAGSSPRATIRPGHEHSLFHLARRYELYAHFEQQRAVANPRK